MGPASALRSEKKQRLLADFGGLESMLVDVATRRRVYQPESDPRAYPANPESASPSLVSSLAERDIYRRQRRRRFPLSGEESAGMVANAATAKLSALARDAQWWVALRYALKISAAGWRGRGLPLATDAPKWRGLVILSALHWRGNYWRAAFDACCAYQVKRMSSAGAGGGPERHQSASIPR